MSSKSSVLIDVFYSAFYYYSNMKNTLIYVITPVENCIKRGPFSLKILYSSLIQLANTTPSETRYPWQMDAEQQTNVSIVQAEAGECSPPGLFLGGSADFFFP